MVRDVWRLLGDVCWLVTCDVMRHCTYRMRSSAGWRDQLRLEAWAAPTWTQYAPGEASESQRQGVLAEGWCGSAAWTVPGARADGAAGAEAGTRDMTGDSGS